MARAIDANELLGIERLLDTDVVRQSKTASWLLDQVLHDIQAMPTLTPPNEWVSVEDMVIRIKDLVEVARTIIVALPKQNFCKASTPSSRQPQPRWRPSAAPPPRPRMTAAWQR